MSPHLTAPHRSSGSGRVGRKTGRTSNRIKKFVPIRCGSQAFDELGWLEADTVSHGGESSSGGEVSVGLERIEKRLPFVMLGFDCDNCSEFLNEVLEAYQLRRNRSVE